MHARLYFIDFLEGDTAGMEREAAAVMGRREYEGFMLDTQSDTAAYSGEFVKARELTRRAIDSARRADEQETMAHFEAQAAPREAMVGNMGMARQLAQAALVLSDSRDVEFNSALALGLAGDKAQATRRANDLDKRFSKDTMVQTQCLPMIRAATFLGRDNTPEEADKAIQALAAAAPYEPGVYSRLYPTYLRGGAYVAAREGAAAAAEFQKILNHPGIVRNDPIGALAHLGLGRAYAVEAGLSRHGENGGVKPPLQPDDLAKARAAYQDFLTLWKEADPDIPILKQAKAEYAKLE